MADRLMTTEERNDYLQDEVNRLQARIEELSVENSTLKETLIKMVILVSRNIK